VNASDIVGILLAAGSGSRFGGDKLLARLTSGEFAGEAIGAAAFRHLREAVPNVIVVVRPGDPSLAAMFGAAGARVVRCPLAADGMGASLACGVRAAGDVSGYIVALADMPWTRAATIGTVRAAIEAGAQIAAPEHRGKRGHPVGFARGYRAQLERLTGDEGARGLIAANAQSLSLLPTDDPGVLRDIDTRADLA
jgi:molybdenum cofactor cytidylyltransferase